MFIEGLGKKLGKNVYLVKFGIKTITDGYIYKTVLPEQGYSRFAPFFGKRIEPCAPSPAQNNT
jgi:hypothetical protein